MMRTVSSLRMARPACRLFSCSRKCTLVGASMGVRWKHCGEIWENFRRRFGIWQAREEMDAAQ